MWTTESKPAAAATAVLLLYCSASSILYEYLYAEIMIIFLISFHVM